MNDIAALIASKTVEQVFRRRYNEGIVLFFVEWTLAYVVFYLLFLVLCRGIDIHQQAVCFS